MKITLTSKMVTVTLPHGAAYTALLMQYVKKNFPSALKLSGSTLLFAREGEIIKNKILLQWVAHIYKKENPAVSSLFLDGVIRSYQLPLKLVIAGHKQIKVVTPLYLWVVDERRLLIRFEGGDRMIYHYFETFFSKMAARARNGNDIVLTVDSTEAAQKIGPLLARRMLLGKSVEWRYERARLEKFLGKIYEAERAKHEAVREDSSYRVLEIDREATVEAVRKSYLKLVKLYHPDRVYGQEAAVVRRYTEKFQQITEAYETIMALRSA